MRARESGVRRLCHGQEPTAAAGPRPKRNRAGERQCCVVRAYRVKRLVCASRRRAVGLGFCHVTSTGLILSGVLGTRRR